MEKKIFEEIMKVNLQNIRKDQKTSVCNQDIEIFSRPMLPLQKLEEKQNKTKKKNKKIARIMFLKSAVMNAKL